MKLSPRQRAAAYKYQAVARFTGSALFWTNPGACAPGFMLTPASQAKATSCAKLRAETNSVQISLGVVRRTLTVSTRRLPAGGIAPARRSDFHAYRKEQHTCRTFSMQ